MEWLLSVVLNGGDSVEQEFSLSVPGELRGRVHIFWVCVWAFVFSR